jgi:hypothetical protein
MASKERRGMIGKSLQERHGLGVLEADRAIAIMNDVLRSHAKPIVEVRARDPRMIACVVANADEAGVRLCRRFGLELKPGGVGVFGVFGADVSRLFPNLSAGQASFVAEPCGPRETKVLLVAGGTAFLSLEASGKNVVITPR